MFKRSIAASIFASAVAALVAPVPAFAVRPDITVPKGQTIVFNAPDDVDRVVVGDASVAEVVQLPGTRTLLINGKAPGFTNFLVFQRRGGAPLNYRLEVLTTGREEQIAVRVQVLETSFRKLGTTGVKWNDSLGFTEAAPNAPFRIGLPIRNDLLQPTINLLTQDRDTKILANPTLVIQNGQKAAFLDGGEVPIPTIQGSGANITYTIDWKQYGVKLDVAARLEGSQVFLNLRPEVSSIDNTNAIKLNGLSVPAIATRWAQTAVQLESGDAIVIAGLLNNTRERDTDKLPFLGDIPFLGALFGEANYDETNSEIVFIVSPQILEGTDVLPEKNYAGSAKQLRK